MRYFIRSFVVCSAMVCGGLWVGVAPAAVQTFTEETLFVTAIAGFQDVHTVNFDSVTPVPATVPSGTKADPADQVALHYAIGTFQVMVDDMFHTPSPNNYLALDSDDAAFLSGDAFTMTFDATAHAVALFVIGEDIVAGDIELQAGAGSVVNAGTPEFTLPDGDVYFLGLVQTDFDKGFTSAQVSSRDPGSGDFYIFNADDITVAAMEAVMSGPLVCDVDGNGQIDRDDIASIFAARGQSSTGPDDPRDADMDGVITVGDGRICVLQCTNPRCAP